MPTLEQVLQRETSRAVFRSSPAWRHRHEEVVALRLATGAPCDGHAEAFADWPGTEAGVTRWYQLAGGAAVAVAGESEQTQRVHLWTSASDPT